MAEWIDPETMVWLRRPPMYMLKDQTLVMETEPYTSFHSRSFDTTSGYCLALKPMRTFGFTVRVDFGFKLYEDECGILLKRSNTHWAKAGVERRMEAQDLSCTVYDGGFGDRSGREIGSGIQWLYFRLLYWNGNARFQYSFNGEKYSDMRWFHFGPQEEPVTAGVYACSPGNSSFDCTFSQMKYRAFMEK